MDKLLITEAEAQKKINGLEYKNKTVSLGHTLKKLFREIIRSDSGIDTETLAWDTAKAIATETKNQFKKEDVERIIRQKLSEQEIVLVMPVVKKVKNDTDMNISEEDRTFIENKDKSIASKYYRLLKKYDEETTKGVLHLDLVRTEDFDYVLNDNISKNEKIRKMLDHYNVSEIMKVLGLQRQRVVNIRKQGQRQRK